MKDTQLPSTSDGRFKVGDRVRPTLEWATRLATVVYQGRKTATEVQRERTGAILEIWTGGSDSSPWTSIRLDVAAAHPWEMPEDLELVSP